MTIPVLLDPGHPSTGGDKGCVAEGIEEYEYTYQFCEMVCDHVTNAGYPVSMYSTRDTKIQVVSHDGRAAIAKAVDAELVLSVHVNSYVNESLHGAYAFSLANDDIAAELGDLWLRCCPEPHYVKGRKTIIIDPVHMVHRYERRINNVLRRYNPIPALLLELAFASHKEDRAGLLDNATQQGMMGAIFALLARFRQLQEKTTYPTFNG